MEKKCLVINTVKSNSQIIFQQFKEANGFLLEYHLHCVLLDRFLFHFYLFKDCITLYLALCLYYCLCDPGLLVTNLTKKNHNFKMT